MIYDDVLERLERDGVRYVVVGGVALVLRGHTREVADLDLVIDGAPDESHRAMLALTSIGFVPSVPLPLSELTVQRMFDHLSREVDVFVRYNIPFGELWTDSELLRVGDGQVRVASPEHLLRAQRLAGRRR